jgi:hypothetical protein
MSSAAILPANQPRSRTRALLADQPNPCAHQWLGDLDYQHLGRRFAGLQQDLGAHASDCTEVLINVHRW